MDYDVVIIGGGPGGYVCALKASQLGLKVAVVDKSKSDLGGTCLTKGCIPTKAILHSASVLRAVKHSSEFGLFTDLQRISLERIVERAKGVIAGLNSGVNGLFNKHKVTFVEGTAKLDTSSTISVEKNGNVSEISAKNIVISTGAKPRMLPGLSTKLYNSELLWTSKEAIFPKFLPHKMLIIGSGAIGIELASFYNEMGSDVTVIELMERILVQEDKEISETATKLFMKQGIKIKAGAKVQNVTQTNGKISAEICTNNGIVHETFDVIVVAIGVVPNVQSLGLEALGIKTKSNGTIETNEYNETSVAGVYAIGDVAEAPWLAHKASREGIRVAEHIAGICPLTPINLRAIPACTYSNPQIASIGMTEEDARSSGRNIKIGKSSFRNNGKALASGEPDGFVKVIFDSNTGELLGAHMIGHEVTEMLPIFSIAMAGELTELDIMAAIFPHPTMSECLQEAVYSAFDVSLNS